MQTMASTASGKRKAVIPPTEQSDEALKAQLRAEGWHFPKDNQTSAPVQPTAVAASAEEAGEILIGMACQNGSQAIDGILSAMISDPRPEVQAQGCNAISVLSEKEAGRNHVLGKGAVQAVVAAMQMHPSAPAVQGRGCAALGNLTVGDGETAVLQGYGVEAVLAAMANHPSDGFVQTKACLALGNMGYGSAGEVAVVDKGGVQAIVAALQAHGSDEKLVEEACDALQNLAANVQAKQTLIDMGLVAMLEAARAAYPASAGVAELLDTLKA